MFGFSPPCVCLAFHHCIFPSLVCASHHSCSAGISFRLLLKLSPHTHPTLHWGPKYKFQHFLLQDLNIICRHGLTRESRRQFETILVAALPCERLNQVWQRLARELWIQPAHFQFMRQTRKMSNPCKILAFYYQHGFPYIGNTKAGYRCTCFVSLTGLGNK